MTVAKEMNNGVALLLERMKTHPEEFTEQGKWVTIMQDMHKYASKEESDELNGSLKALMMQKLTERVLEELVDPKDGVSLYNMAHPKGTGLGGATQGHSTALNQATNTLNAIGSPYTLTANNNGNISWTNTAPSLTIGDTTLNEATIKQMLEAHKAMRAQEKAEQEAKRKKHKTIFGKLHNYLGANK